MTTISSLIRPLPSKIIKPIAPAGLPPAFNPSTFDSTVTKFDATNLTWDATT